VYFLTLLLSVELLVTTLPSKITSPNPRKAELGPIPRLYVVGGIGRALGYGGNWPPALLKPWGRLTFSGALDCSIHKAGKDTVFTFVLVQRFRALVRPYFPDYL
jgi:hypothetical protein